MNDPIFHPFHRLPWELREQVWQDAAYWQTKRVGCIRYVKMDRKQNLLPLDCSWNADDAGNESDFTWGSYLGPPGLWTACRHSHAVAKKIRNSYCDACGWCRPAWFCKRVFAPQDSGACQGIDLHNDVCCITSDSWEYFLDTIWFRTKDVRGVLRFERVVNIGMTFDPDWNRELEDTTEDTVIDVHSPQLAFAIRVIMHLARSRSSELPETKLMLIDNVSKWQSFNLERHGGREIFDGDQEYVEIVSLAGAGHHVAMKDSPMDEFMEHLRTSYLREIILSSGPRGWECLLYSGFFRPLLRRENYVPGRPI